MAWIAATCASAGAEKKDYQVSQGSDDAEETVSSGAMNLTSTDLELISDGSTAQLVGIRFQAIEIPPGATITSAVIELETDETDSGATSVTIRGEDIDDAPTFTTTSSNISSRTLTTASVAWNSIPAWNTVSERHQTPDLSAIVQEIVDRGGWTAGNDMVFVITGSGERTAESFNGESANAPILRIEFEGITPAPGSALCYGAADGGDRFVFIDVTDGTVDTNVGPLGASSIEAIAIDPNGLDVYGADRDELGRIDTDTGAFLRLTETFGTGGGSAGNITFDDVDSLAFDHDSGTLWGVDARGGDDALFQIDPDTGAHVPDAFGVGVDYVLITGVGSRIDDIAIDPSTGTLYASDTSNSQLITVNTTTGAGTAVGSFGGSVDMEGMGFHSDGTLYGTEGQRLYTVNTSTGAATQVGSGDTLTVGSDYEAFDCHFTALARAVITRFDASSDGGQTRVVWETASEDGTAGFYLYRYDYAARQWRALNDALLPALVGAPQGGTYQFVDDSGLTGPLLYALLEVEVNGRIANRGMYAPRAEEASELPGDSRRFTRRARRALRDTRRAVKRRLMSRARRGEELKLRVRERGMVHVAAADLAEALGTGEGRFWVAREIGAGRVSLLRGGTEVAWTPAPDGSGLYFYARGNDSIYGADDVYHLRFATGVRMKSTRLVSAGPAPADASFVDHTDFEDDRFPATVVAHDPSADFWFWEFLSAGSPSYGTRTFSFDASGIASGAAVLELRLYGATTTGLDGEHRAVVRVNDVELGIVSFDGIGLHTASLPVPGGLLNAEANVLSVDAVLATAPYSILYVDGFQLSYPRHFVASAGTLGFRADDNPAVTLRGFGDATPFVFDISNPSAPRTVHWDGGPSFVPRSSDREYVALTADRFQGAVIEPWAEAEPRLWSRANRVDYLVIAADHLRDAAQELADYRSAQGLQSRVVTRSEVENEFSHGFRSADAIRTFLAASDRRWQKAPRFVVLVGEGSLDYKNLLGHDDSSISPLLRRGTHGLYASDSALVRTTEAPPAMALGRIPVSDAVELSRYVEKLRTFENSARFDELVMLSDAPDVGGAFASDSERLARVLPRHVDAVPISLEHLPVGLARSQLFERLRAGTGLVTYAGHGGLDRLTNAGLLMSSDVSSLEDAAHASIFVSLSCSTNRFDIPGFDSLGEALVGGERGGAVAIWGPAGMTAHGQSAILGQLFLEAVFRSDHDRLGDAVLEALVRYGELPDADRLLTTFNLLGDPATRLPR